MTLRQQIIDDHVEKTSAKLLVDKSKAFAVFAHCLCIDKSIHSFDENDNVDGGQDKQIDIITIDEEPDEAYVYINQIKYEPSFSSNCIIQIANGLKWIFEKSKADVNTLHNVKFRDKILEYRRVQSDLGPSNIHVKVAYITNGNTSDLSDEAKQEIKSIIDKYDNGVFSSFSFDTIGCDELIDVLNTQEKRNKKINCDIKIIYDTNNPSLIKYHNKGMTGIICTTTASEIATIVNSDKSGFVFDLNIRKYLGKLGGVNKDIINTCTNSYFSHLFWFLNNGITIICDKVEPVTDPDNAIVKINNMQIVNGCQTATSLANALKDGHLQSDTRVLLRIYETNDLELVDKIVLTTNNQNKITGRNLRSNDRSQIDLEKGFQLYEYHMERKSRQYENTTIPKEKIIPNEDIAVAYLAIVLKKPSDSRSRKYKVWNELYSKIFTGTNIIEPYLLSVLIHKNVVNYLWSKHSTSEDNNIRYLAKNASFHISRITSFLWRKNDIWTDKSTLKQQIQSISNNNSILDSIIDEAIQLLNHIIITNQKFTHDINNSLKSYDLDTEINKQLHSNQINTESTIQQNLFSVNTN